MKHILLLAVLMFSCFLLTAQQLPSAAVNPKLGYKIISAAGNTVGYEIYVNGKLFIHQTTIPAVPGNKGFATKSAAEKVAKKVITKIKNGENPPTITIKELKKLKVI